MNDDGDGMVRRSAVGGQQAVKVGLVGCGQVH
jgi:hypothetical protein